MKLLQFVFLAGCILKWSPSLMAQEELTLVNNVRAKLEKVNQYEADGTMKIDVAFIKAPDSKVKVYFKKPDKFTIKKESGISVLPKGGVHINLSSLLSDGHYTVVNAGDAVLEGQQLRVVKLLPADENSDVVVSTLYIDPKQLLIRKTIVTTRENGTYEMEMKYGAYSNWGLPDKVLFTFNLKDYKLPKSMTFEYENGDAKQKDNTAKSKKGMIEISYSAYRVNKDFSEKVFQ